MKRIFSINDPEERCNQFKQFMRSYGRKCAQKAIAKIDPNISDADKEDRKQLINNGANLTFVDFKDPADILEIVKDNNNNRTELADALATKVNKRCKQFMTFAKTGNPGGPSQSVPQ